MIVLSNFAFAGNNYDEPVIDEAYVAIANNAVEKTLTCLTTRYQSQSLSAHVQSLVVSCNTCTGVK